MQVSEVTQADAKLLGMPTTGDVEKPCTKALMIYGSKVKAARALGIAETTFRDRLKREHVA